MAQAREIAKQLGKASNQEALVKRMLKQTIKPIKFVIPGGKNLIEDLDKEGLKSACYTWLRACKAFTQVTISLAADPTKYRTRERKIIDFDVGQYPVWETHKERRKYLADHIGTALFEHEVVAVLAKADGLYIVEDLDKKFSPTSEDWEPHVEFIPRKLEPWKETA